MARGRPIACVMAIGVSAAGLVASAVPAAAGCIGGDVYVTRSQRPNIDPLHRLSCLVDRPGGYPVYEGPELRASRAHYPSGYPDGVGVEVSVMSPITPP